MPRTYTQLNPDGTYSLVTANDDGTYTAQNYGADRSGAENAYNASQGGTPTIGGKSMDQMRAELQAAGYGGPWDDASVQATYARTVNGGSAGGGTGDWSGLWNSLTGSNQQQFDEQKRQFDVGFGEQKRQFDTNTWSGMAQALLSGAANLRGPEDWLKYAQYTTGGKNIFDRLAGDQAAPAFGAPTGNSAPATINTLLRDLGLATEPVTGGTSGASAGNYNTVNGVKTLQQMRDELIKASGGMDYWRTAPDETVISEYGKVTKGGVSAAGMGTGDMNLGQATGLGGNTGAGIWDEKLTLAPNLGATAPNTQPTTQTSPQVSAQNMAPLPYQINPAVWDSLNDTAKKMILSSAEAGKTPSGAWSADDYLNQMEAARPKGTAPRQVSFNWGSPKSAF
jgi:hypothetical protein